MSNLKGRRRLNLLKKSFHKWVWPVVVNGSPYHKLSRKNILINFKKNKIKASLIFVLLGKRRLKVIDKNN